MIRHIFIGTLNEGLDQSTRDMIFRDMAAMRDNIPQIARQDIGFSTGWAGLENQVVMTVDFATKADFDAYMAHPYHRGHIDDLGDAYFDRTSFVSAQFEF